LEARRVGVNKFFKLSSKPKKNITTYSGGQPKKLYERYGYIVYKKEEMADIAMKYIRSATEFNKL
jgi:hypothetical protein